MPTNVRGANLPAPRGLPSAAKLPGTPVKNAPKPLPRAPTAKASSPFVGIPKTFAGAPKLQQAYKDTAKPAKATPTLPPSAVKGLRGARQEALESSPNVRDQLSAASSMKPLIEANRRAVAQLPKPKGEGAGAAVLGTILAPGKTLGAITADIPKELTGTGAVEKGIKGAAGAIGRMDQQGYQGVLGTTGVGGAVSKVIGNTARDVVELPAQILPSLYVAGKAGVKGLAPPGTSTHKESEDELRKLVHSYTHESAIGNLLTGNVKGAVQAAERNPLYAGLEASGVGAAVDRAGGAAARAGALGPDLASATKLADKGATTVSRAPQDLIGNAKAPLDPYSKRLMVRLKQGKNDPTVRPGETLVKQLTGKSLSSQLVKHFDRQTGSLEAVRRNSRAEVVDARMKGIGGVKLKTAALRVPTPGSRAVNAFARGLLADPKVLNEHGTPLYRDQLSKLVELHAKPVPGELPFQAHNRMGKVAEYQAMLDDPRLQQHPEVAHAAAVKYAQDLKALEPQLVAHDYLTPHSIKVAKLADPFQFHWQGHDPQFSEQPPLNARGQAFVAAEKARADAHTARQGSLVEVERAKAAGDKTALAEAMARHKANIAAHHQAVASAHGLTPASPMDLHESPFSIAAPRKPGEVPTGERQHIPVDQVEKTLLEKHGVDPKNIGFVSNRPYVNDSAAYYRSNTDPTKAGFNPQKQRTGAAFLRGQYDTSHDALVRQHLTNQGLIDQARGSKMQVKTYALTKAHIADLLQEKVDQLPAHEQPAVKALIAELHTGSTFFEPHSGTAAWDHAQRAIAQVEHMHPDLKLQPGRIAHPFAPAKQLDAIAKHSLEATHDRLDPALWEQNRGTDRFPQDATLQKLDSGPVGVYPKAIADRMKAYEKQTGSEMGKLLRTPASWWRRANIAFSVKHIAGLGQELGIRAAANNIGPLSYLRGLRLLNHVERVAADPQFLKDHPEVALEAQRLKAQVGGTGAQQTMNLMQHVSANKLPTSLPGAAARALRMTAEQPITGAPLRVVKDVVGAYSGVASKILSVERKALEHPAQIAGLGKHANNEAKAMMGKSLPVFRSVTDVQQKMAEGLLSQPAIDHAARQLVQYWGDWTSASPAVKNVLAVAPFFNWYRNSLRFLYSTMPVHHPVKTALLTALEGATVQQRAAIGQGHSAAEKLEAEQQGGIPIGEGYVANQQYYTPQGAVTDAPGTAASLLLPEVTGAYKAITGTNPFGQTLTNAKKEPITDQGERAMLAVSALLESFNPLLRDAAQIIKGGKTSEAGSTLWDLKAKKGEASVDPIAKALGIKSGPLLGAYNAFRPFKTTKERTEQGKPPGRGLPGPTLPNVNLPTINLPTVNLPTVR